MFCHAFKRFPKVLLRQQHRLLATTKVLSPLEHHEALTRLAQNGIVDIWKDDSERKAIRKTYEFTDFSQAWAFMSRVALLAEKLDHHPEWFNVYNTVDVTLTTHDCGGVSKKDIEMAEAMDRFASDLLPMRR